LTDSFFIALAPFTHQFFECDRSLL
jgi:hypothetical protein